MSETKKVNSCTIFKQDCDCFNVLTKEQMQIVEDNQVIVEYEKDKIFARQGAFASHIIVIEEGLAKVTYEDGHNNLVLRISTPGSFIGLSSISDQNRLFGYTAKAYIKTKVKLIDIGIFISLIKENSLFGLELLRVMSEISHQKNARFFGLMHRQSYGKLADLLLCMSVNIFKEKAFILPLTRKQIGELAGMSTESVIRTFKNFQEDKLISIEGKKITILDMEGLVKVFETG